MDIVYLPFNHEELPVQKTFDIDGANYNIAVDYNWRADFYTLAITDDDDNLIFSGKVVYLENIIDAVADGLGLSKKIVPLNIEDIQREYPLIEKISVENFNTVRLALL